MLPEIKNHVKFLNNNVSLKECKKYVIDDRDKRNLKCKKMILKRSGVTTLKRKKRNFRLA